MKISTKQNPTYTITLSEDEAKLMLELLVNDITCTATKFLSTSLTSELRNHLNANS